MTKYTDVAVPVADLRLLVDHATIALQSGKVRDSSATKLAKAIKRAAKALDQIAAALPS
jgi:hypothetical protein